MATFWPRFVYERASRPAFGRESLLSPLTLLRKLAPSVVLIVAVLGGLYAG